MGVKFEFFLFSRERKSETCHSLGQTEYAYFELHIRPKSWGSQQLRLVTEDGLRSVSQRALTERLFFMVVRPSSQDDTLLTCVEESKN
jgi:hypothetical protein